MKQYRHCTSCSIPWPTFESANRRRHGPSARRDKTFQLFMQVEHNVDVWHQRVVRRRPSRRPSPWEGRPRRRSARPPGRSECRRLRRARLGRNRSWRHRVCSWWPGCANRRTGPGRWQGRSPCCSCSRRGRAEQGPRTGVVSNPETALMFFLLSCFRSTGTTLLNANACVGTGGVWPPRIVPGTRRGTGHLAPHGEDSPRAPVREASVSPAAPRPFVSQRAAASCNSTEPAVSNRGHHAAQANIESPRGRYSSRACRSTVKCRLSALSRLPRLLPALMHPKPPNPLVLPRRSTSRSSRRRHLRSTLPRKLPARHPQARRLPSVRFRFVSAATSVSPGFTDPRTAAGESGPASRPLRTKTGSRVKCRKRGSVRRRRGCRYEWT